MIYDRVLSGLGSGALIAGLPAIFLGHDHLAIAALFVAAIAANLRHIHSTRLLIYHLVAAANASNTTVQTFAAWMKSMDVWSSSVNATFESISSNFETIAGSLRMQTTQKQADSHRRLTLVPSAANKDETQ